MINNNFMEDILAKVGRMSSDAKESLDMISGMMDETIKNVPEEHKHKAQQLSTQLKSAVTAAKNGDVDSINNIINIIKDGR